MSSKNAYLILIHGFGRTNRSLSKLEKVLSAEGYTVINMHYPSRDKNIEDIAEQYLKKIIAEQCTDKTKPIHFVTHSMGGIVLRYFLAKNKLPNLGRVVMLAPPNSGAPLTDYLSKSKILNTVFGPALKELNTGKDSFLHSLPLPNFEVGIIAGKYDDKVPVENTKLANMKDFLLVPGMHNIMNRSDVIEAVKNFLERGTF